MRVAFGNGLRRDVWEQFKRRFQVPIIGEFYAATEGNAGFINHFNKVGSVGRASPLMVSDVVTMATRGGTFFEVD